MASHPRSTRLRVDGDGLTVLATPGARRVRWLLVSALALLGLAAVVTVRLTRSQPSAREAGAPASAGPGAPATPPRAVPDLAAVEAAVRAAVAADPARARDHARQAATQAQGQVQEEPTFTLPEPGETGGLAVFPPPGTKPIKRGIVVPDDFELPEGYVRHYQTTDDGRRLPPILMFHPDYQGLDAHGNPVPLPEDRIVPPGMAPPGLAVQTLGDPEQGGARDRPR